MRTRSNSPKYLEILRWLNQHKTNKPNNDISTISTILPNLYLTSRKGISVAMIKDYNIQAILSIGSKLKKDEISCLGDYLFLNIPDSSEKACMMKNILSETKIFIDTNIDKGPILVHCQMDISRSPTIIISYLISVGWNPKESIKHVKTCRECIYPNEGYLQLLFGS